MKWLLISNNNNPGDIWVRLGVQAIIRRLDKDPVFIVRERDYRDGDPHRGLTEPGEPIQFDYSVICGMPLLWSHFEPDGTLSTTTQHAWWHPLNTWCAPQKMIVAGFGIMLISPDIFHTFQSAAPGVVSEIQEFFDRCLLVYSRSPLAKQFFPKIASVHCPSVLAMLNADNARDLKLANLMPGGGHYPGLAQEEAAVWEGLMPRIARKLLDAGYHFVAHRPDEERLALELGWPNSRIFTWRPDGTGHCLLEVYGRCSKYFGNRIHGGIMSRAAGADVTVVGYDTRLADVHSMFGQVFTPSQAKDFLSVLEDWIASPPRPVPYDVELIRRAHLSWWSSKLKLPIME